MKNHPAAALDDMYQFDTVSNEWSTLPVRMPARSQFGIASLQSKIFVFGGWNGTGVFTRELSAC